jgi:SNF2 family DNA or RNA helicase
MEGPQKTAYKQMQKEAQADFKNGTLLANSVFAEITRLKQFANSYGRLDDSGNYLPTLPSNKFDWILQFLRERGLDTPEPTGSRVIIASQFTKHINLFAKELQTKHSVRCYVLTGATAIEDRVRYQEEFQSGKLSNGKPSPEVMLLNSKAGGNSITLDAADDMVVIDRRHSSDDQVQLEDRIHRLSRIHSVNIWNLVSRGSIEEKILKVTLATGMSLKRILDTPAKFLDMLDS